MLATLSDIEHRITLMVRPLEEIVSKLHECLRMKEPIGKHDFAKLDSSKKLVDRMLLIVCISQVL